MDAPLSNNIDATAMVDTGSTTALAVRKIWKDSVQSLGSEFAHGREPAAKCDWTEKFERAQPGTPRKDSEGSINYLHRTWTPAETSRLIGEECDRLHKAAAETHGDVFKLDRTFSELVECKFRAAPQKENDILERAVSLLGRMPERPTPLPDELDAIDGKYFRNADGKKEWDNLKVVSFNQTNLVRYLLYISLMAEYGDVHMLGGSLVASGWEISIGTSSLIACASRRSSMPGLSQEDRDSWFIVRAYLWAFWQRLKMLRLFAAYSSFTTLGTFHTPDIEIYLQDQDFEVSPTVTLADLTMTNSEVGRARSVCTWVLNLLRTEPSCLGLDFRLLHERYAASLGKDDGRCNRESNDFKPCDGEYSSNCLRFFGLSVKDQSTHDASCTLPCSCSSSNSNERKSLAKFRKNLVNRLSPVGAQRQAAHQASCAIAQQDTLFWDETSYLQTTGARAVVLSEPSASGSRKFRYCKASDQTMAISHVWSHGQGGRPEEGMNRCLHQRYSRIAKELNCTSYWMDTACIPDSHKLRKEAILHINGVFANSKVVLVCDKDLAKIDIDNYSLATLESILAVLIFSDWNTRAWTLLESSKGRGHIFLLCMHNKVVSFQDILSRILVEGRIDIAVFISHVQHMLPKPGGNEEMLARMKLSTNPMASETGALLSYRPASRPGDEFVIWSLLSAPDAEPVSTPQAFWMAQLEQNLHTGFLLSSAERMSAKGFTWAPRTPYVTTRDGKPAGVESSSHRASAAYTTCLGKIKEDGFWALWSTHSFSASIIGKHFRNGKSGASLEELDKIRSKLLGLYPYGILLAPRHESPIKSLIQLGAMDMCNSANGTLVAVCGSTKMTVRNNSYKWIWRGVYEWPRSVPLPKFDTATREVWIA